MKPNIIPLQIEEKDHFKEVYLKALEADWETLEGDNKSDQWNFNFDQWFSLKHLILVMKIEDKITGYICGDSSRILHLWVDKEYRSCGYGRDLFHRFLEIQKQNGYTSFSLTVFKNNFEYFENLGCVLTVSFGKYAFYEISIND